MAFQTEPHQCFTFKHCYTADEQNTEEAPRTISEPETYVEKHLNPVPKRYAWIRAIEHAGSLGSTLFLRLEANRVLHLAFDSRTALLKWMEQFPSLGTLPTTWITTTGMNENRNVPDH